MRRFFSAGLVAVALAGCGGATDDTRSARVARVVDGDTIVVSGGEHVRLVQIDAPEEGESECYADEATVALERLAPPGSDVELERDPALDDVDRYGRLLRYVHADGANVNLELVRRGAAGVWFYRGERGRYADELLDAARAAKDRPRGLWRACRATPFDPKAAIETRAGG